MVIEAIVENEAAKVKLYGEIEKLLPPGAILASNTSTISITRMAKSVKAPERFAGMHFFNPVDRMQLVEVIRGEKTSDATVVTLVALAKHIGKTPIVVRDCPGFLVNRILFPYLNESLVLLEEGASPRGLDKAATAFGMPMGPVTLNDLVGSGYVALRRPRHQHRLRRPGRDDAHPRRPGGGRPAGPEDGRRLLQLRQAGSRRRRSGPGRPSWKSSGKARREIGMEEMTDRLFLPMLTEASRVLSEGIVREPGDVDMGLILGIGFPPFRGGILRWADAVGLPNVLEKLKKYEHLGPRFQPTEQMRKLAAEGKGFYPDA